MSALDFPHVGLTVGQKYPQPPIAGKPIYTWDGAKWTTGDTSYQAAGEPSNAIPRMDGDPGEVGTSLDYSRGDHRHPVDTSRAPIADPHFLGTPTAPTPPVGDNSERLATTAHVVEAAFVMGNALPSDSTPLMDGTASFGTSIMYSRDDHVHPSDTSRAALADPVFTGVPQAPTAASGTSTAQIATTAFVDDAVTSAGAIAPSDVLPLIDSGTGAIGVSTAYSRGDHVHPNNSPLPATVAPLGDAGAAVIGASAKYAREDHVHPENPDAVTKTYVDNGLAGKSSTGHTHASTGITDFAEAVDDRVGSLLVAGTNVSLDYNDTANTLTITSTAAGGGGGTGDVLGPTSAVADRIAIFSGTTGKIIKDGGSLISALQPVDAELTAIAGLVGAADRLPYFTGPGAAALTPLTGFGRSLIDDADATAAKTTLGIAGAALTLSNDTNVQLTAGGSSSTALLATSSITAGWAGTLSAARGGFGANVAAQTGVPLFATGVATFTPTTGTGDFVRKISPTLTTPVLTATPAAGDNTTAIASTAFVTGSALRYDAAQALTAAQQLQARKNAYAAPLDALAYSGIQVNGGMNVMQDFPAGRDINNASSALYIMDNWIAQIIDGSGAALLHVIPGGNYFAGVGFPQFMAVTAGTPLATQAAGDATYIAQYIEGHRISRLAWGTANAQPITISFWTAHTRTGTYSVSIRNGAADRSYVASYTQSVANAAEYKTITLATGDTLGTWAAGNTTGLSIAFCVAAGSTFTTSPGTWTAGNKLAATGQVNGIGAGTDNFRITGITMHPGSEAPTSARSPFIARPYGDELAICQRYFQVLGGEGNPTPLGSVQNSTGPGGVADMTLPLKVPMRVAPTITQFGTWTFLNIQGLSTYPATNCLGWQIFAAAAGYAQAFGGAGNGGYWLDARM